MFQQSWTPRRQLLLFAALAAACYVVSMQVFSRGLAFRHIGGSGGDAAKSRLPAAAVSVDMTPRVLQARAAQSVVHQKAGVLRKNELQRLLLCACVVDRYAHRCCPGSCAFFELAFGPLPAARENEQVLDAPVAPNDKVAIMVDGSDAVELIPVICQFLAILPEWKFVIFHGEANSHKLNSSTILARWAAVGQLRLVRVPDTFSIESEAGACSFLAIARERSGVSRLFKDPWLWRQLSEEHVLVFRTDSALCSSSPRNIDNYLHYDFIGAPHVENGKLVYDGGLSIRRRSKMLAAIELLQERRATAARPAGAAAESRSPTAAAAHGAGLPPSVAEQPQHGPKLAEGEGPAPVLAAPAEAAFDDDLPEDRFFSEVLADMPDSCLPSPETAAEFSIAREWFEGSLGARALWVWHPPAIARHFRRKCPDFNLVNMKSRRLLKRAEPPCELSSRSSRKSTFGTLTLARAEQGLAH
ncbi:MAG: hypothetical protein BJ554DRAFT_2842, partial [Olpidium bornovanus]